MNEDIKEEFKSTRRSIGGGGGFYGTVENVSETSDREYYAFLNVTPESSEDEIKAAYKRLALLWHPDRHKEEESRERATAQFAKLTQIHDVLSDPKKRKLYDLYGEKGLSSGMEVGAHLRTHDQVRDEYIRHMVKKKQKHLEAKLGLAGVLQTTVDLRDYLSASDYVSNRGGTGGSGGGSGAAGEQDKRSLLTSAMLSQRFRTSLSRKDTMELQGQVISKKGNGASLLTLSGKRQFSVRSWAKMMLQAGLGVEQVPFSFAAFRQLSKETMSKVSLRFAGAVLELKCALQHRMSDDSLGRIQYILGGDRGGVKVKMTKSGERTVVNASVWVGMRQYSIAATWNRHLSKRTLISVALNLGEAGLALDLTSRRRISENSSCGCQCMLSLLKGVTLKLSLGRMGQELAVPIMLSRHLTLKAVVYGAVVPCITQILLKALWIGPRARRRKARKLAQLRQSNAESTQRARKEAAADVQLMKFAVERKRRLEEDRRGLVILQAVYGRLPPLPGTAAASTTTSSSRRSFSRVLPDWPGEEKEEGGGGFTSVTAPLQYLTEDSKLLLFNPHKSGLPGFYDPCPGEEKALYVLYRFKGTLHEVCVSDSTPLTIPLPRDKLPEHSQRVVDGQLLSQPSSAANTRSQTSSSTKTVYQCL